MKQATDLEQPVTCECGSVHLARYDDIHRILVHARRWAPAPVVQKAPAKVKPRSAKGRAAKGVTLNQ